MGRLKHQKKAMSLSLFYLKYVFLLSFSIAMVGLLSLFLFQIMINSDFIYPANYAERGAAGAYNQLKTADEVTPDMIPELCQYMLFDSDGTKKQGTIDQEDDAAWNAVLHQVTYNRGNYYLVIPRDGEYCVLKYKLIAQYKSESLRRYLLPPQTMFIIISLVLIITLVLLEAMRFGRLLKEKLHSIIDAAERIQQRELDFTIPDSGIKEVNHILLSMDDMRKALKDSLERQWKAEQIRKEQISALAHDIKTPLTIIRGNAELLYDTSLSEEQQECIDFIDHSSIQMQNYVAQLIEATKTSNTLEFHYQDITITSFLQAVSMQAKGLCAGREITLDWEAEPESGMIHIDQEYLLRAVVNVISNAADYTPDGGTIRIKTGNEADHWYITVSDTGKGFSQDSLKYAADQFYMEERSRMSKTHYGLGLYIAKTIISQHEGELVLSNSESLGGAEVTIKIPFLKS